MSAYRHHQQHQKRIENTIIIIIFRRFCLWILNWKTFEIYFRSQQGGKLSASTNNDAQFSIMSRAKMQTIRWIFDVWTSLRLNIFSGSLECWLLASLSVGPLTTWCRSGELQNIISDMFTWLKVVDRPGQRQQDWLLDPEVVVDSCSHE